MRIILNLNKLNLKKIIKILNNQIEKLILENKNLTDNYRIVVEKNENILKDLKENIVLDDKNNKKIKNNNKDNNESDNLITMLQIQDQLLNIQLDFENKIERKNFMIELNIKKIEDKINKFENKDIIQKSNTNFLDIKISNEKIIKYFDLIEEKIINIEEIIDNYNENINKININKNDSIEKIKIDLSDYTKKIEKINDSFESFNNIKQKLLNIIKNNNSLVNNNNELTKRIEYLDSLMTNLLDKSTSNQIPHRGDVV